MSAALKAIDKLGYDKDEYEVLAKDFKEFQRELQDDDTVEAFRLEYETLHRALKKSHESEQRLLKKCHELYQNIVSTSKKSDTAVRLSEEDQEQILNLTRDVQRTWSAVEESHRKENSTREALTLIKAEIEDLRASVERGAYSSVAAEKKLRDMTAMRDEIGRETDEMQHQCTTARTDIRELTERVRGLEGEKVTADVAISELKSVIGSKKTEVDRERKRKERLESSLKEVKGSVEERDRQIRAKQASVAEGNDELRQLELSLRENKQNTDRFLKEADTLSLKVQKLAAELEERTKLNASLHAENVQRAAELKHAEAEIDSVKKEVSRHDKLRQAVLDKVAAVDAKRAMADDQRDELKVLIAAQEPEIEAERKKRELERKAIDDLVRERDILNKNCGKVQAAVQTQLDLLRVNENTKHNLEMEISGCRNSSATQARTLKRLQVEKQRYATDVVEAQSKYAMAVEEVKSREISVLQLQKKIAEGEARMKQQQNLYEAVRSDRNIYSKKLIEDQDEITEMKRKFKVMTRQIEQLKEEIQKKDKALVKEHFEHKKIEKETAACREGLAAVQHSLSQVQAEHSQKQAEVLKLHHIINDAEAERARQQKEHDVVVNEREILGAQLIKRNDELAQLYEKIKLQQCTLNRGEEAYAERLSDLSVVQNEYQALKTELHVLRASLGNEGLLKHEVVALSRELLQERTKVRALSEELDNQMNVHRWRKLEGSDPNTYNLIKRTHALQKQLIRRTEEVTERDRLIQQKEKLYVELKAVLARQPGPEVAEQLSVYQENLVEKQKQLKAMTAELESHRHQVEDMKAEQEVLLNRLSQLKRRYFSKRQKELRQHQMEMEMGMGSVEYDMRAMSSVVENSDAAPYSGARDLSKYDDAAPMPGTIDHFAPPASDAAPDDATMSDGAGTQQHPLPTQGAGGFAGGGAGSAAGGGASLGGTFDFPPEEQ